MIKNILIIVVIGLAFFLIYSSLEAHQNISYLCGWQGGQRDADFNHVLKPLDGTCQAYFDKYAPNYAKEDAKKVFEIKGNGKNIVLKDMKVDGKWPTKPTFDAHENPLPQPGELLSDCVLRSDLTPAKIPCSVTKDQHDINLLSIKGKKDGWWNDLGGITLMQSDSYPDGKPYKDLATYLTIVHRDGTYTITPLGSEGMCNVPQFKMTNCSGKDSPHISH